MTSIEKITSSIFRYMNATKKLEEESEDQEFSTGSGHYILVDEQEEAIQELEKALESYIDERVEIAIKKALK